MLLLMKVPIEIVPQLQNQMIARQRERRKMEPLCTITTCTTIIITPTLHLTATPTSSQGVPVILRGWASVHKPMGLVAAEEVG